ncbi:MAG: hypothetical protein ACUVV0_06970 [Anaerolineae bacterium]
MGNGEMKGRIFARRAADLAATLAPFDGELKYAYVESMAEAELVRYGEWGDYGLAFWTLGRAFGPELEIRWEREGGDYNLLLLSEKEDFAPEGWRKVEEAEVDEERKIFLWGTYRQRERKWIETRIPRPLRYPVEGNGRVCILACDYIKDGMTIMTRFREVG